MTASDINDRVQKHRATLRASGLRPIQIWVPDTRRPGFSEEIKRQCETVAKADNADHDLQDLMDATLLDVDDEWEV
ncbi:antitoxin MazE family protein [Halomonas sp. ISL-60]|uniref:antitoxin MazE family protein n=1 Tax=unclassified Halomonas TaxID=2609666 RepID=UPI001BE79471|nr:MULTISPECIES: antitoxin MazE family protein [unclassified Halomonas]MBT2773325.1 antitoxin MazE family protein [Halomonas sp. ISL-60]MBT2801895.1 antitoxin MazE family protein [Halomonas sp. ISL-56]MDQ7731912.1 antitoxin MazE family protein [Halomonas sp. SpR1]